MAMIINMFTGVSKEEPWEGRLDSKRGSAASVRRKERRTDCWLCEPTWDLQEARRPAREPQRGWVSWGGRDVRDAQEPLVGRTWALRTRNTIFFCVLENNSRVRLSAPSYTYNSY